MIGMVGLSPLSFTNPESRAAAPVRSRSPGVRHIEVSIKHVAAAFEGAECEAWARLEEVIEDRKFRFSVEVREGERVLGTGIHERRLIQVPPPE